MTDLLLKSNINVSVEKHCKDVISLHFSSTIDANYVTKYNGESALTLDTNEIQALQNDYTDI